MTDKKTVLFPRNRAKAPQPPKQRKNKGMRGQIKRLEDMIIAYREAQYLTRKRNRLADDARKAHQTIREHMRREIVPLLRYTTAHEIVKEMGYTNKKKNLIYMLRKEAIENGLITEDEMFQSDAAVVKSQREYLEKKGKI